MPEDPIVGTTIIEVIRLFVLLVGATAVVSLVARRFAVPYTVALVVFGLIVGAVARTPNVQLSPEIVLIVLLPGLIFEASYKIDYRQLRSSLPFVALLAGPGVFAVAIAVAFVLEAATGLPFEIGFVIGAMVSATDPAAVIASFKRLGTPRRLSTFVEAESLFNDGTGIVAFSIAVAALTRPTSPGEAIGAFVLTVVVSTVIGVVAGVIATRLIVGVNDHLIELSVSLVLAYGTYLAADALHESGIIATAVAGLVLGNYGRRVGLSRRTIEALDTVWEFLAFLLTAIVFLVVGLAIPITDLADTLVYVGWTLVTIVGVRAILIYGMVGPIARAVGRIPILPTPWLHVVFWSGLRGAVSVALALSLPIAFPQRHLVQGVVFGVVLVTLLGQATTAEPLVRWLGLAARRSGPDDPPAGSDGKLAAGGDP